MFISKIPNNTLTNEIKELICLCEAKGKNLSGTFFKEAASIDTINRWEEENQISIPHSYREWLEFSEYCQIEQDLAELYPPEMFEILKEYESNYIQIGNLIGDGEILCFNKNDGLFYRILDGQISSPINSFLDILKEINRMLGNNSGISNDTIQKLLRMLKEEEANK